MRDVLVIGGSGFVGQVVLQELAARDVAVTALVRGNPEIALGPDGPKTATGFGGLTPRSFDVVVNLAYPTSGTVSTYRAQTEELIAGIDGVLADGGRFVQVSTQAAFGLALDRPVKLGPAPRARDVPYVEAKLAAERLAAGLAKRRSVAVEIVRLGNVGGGAGWTQQVANRLVTGRPVDVHGHDGYSNLTDVANAASYIAFLAFADVTQRGLKFHHLAEFSSTRWSFWTDKFAEALGVTPVGVPAAALQDRRLRDELGQAFGPFSPLRVYRTLRDERVMGSWMRTVRSWVPDRFAPAKPAVEVMFAAPPALDADDVTFLEIVSATQEFRTAVDPGWSPPLGLDASVARAVEWLRRDWRR